MPAKGSTGVRVTQGTSGGDRSRTLILGGARSGKSAHAEKLLGTEPTVTYVATATRDPDDVEWQDRIDAHIRRRPSAWRTVEIAESADLAAILTGAASEDPPLLVDDIATWLTGALDLTGGWEGDLTAVRDHCDELVAAAEASRARLILVSAEVGLGVVPVTRSGRLFRDELGTLNARLARACDEAVLLVAGIPLRLK